MATIADLLIKIGVDTQSASKDLDGFGNKMQKGVKKGLIPATVALGALGVAAKIGFDEFKAGEQVSAQTNAVLKSTGGIANVTAGHVDSLASSLLKKSGVDDEVIKSGENMLLTFTNIRNETGRGNDIFDRATKTVLDMSVALGQDTKSSAIQLGKALNDPIKGVSALQRVGVSFTAALKDQIKGLVAHGKTLEAQKLILGELTKEFGGSATAAGKTFAGKMNIAKEEAKNFAAELIRGAMPALAGLAGGLGKATDFAEKHQSAVKIAIGVIAGLAAVVIVANVALKLYAAAQAVARAATLAWTAAQWLLNAALAANPIALVIIALVALGAALYVAWTKSATFRSVVTGAFNAVRGAAMAVLNFMRSNWPAIATLMSGPFLPIVALATNAFGVRSALIGAFNTIKSAAAGAIGSVVGHLREIESWPAAAVRDVLEKAFARVASIFRILSSVLSTVVGLLGRIIDLAQKAVGWVGKVGSLAGKIGGVAGKVGGIIPHAAGGVVRPGEVSLVGEQGPELVRLPGGSRVFSNSESGRMLGGQGGPAVNIEGDLVIREEFDFERAAAMFGRRLAVVSP